MSVRSIALLAFTIALAGLLVVVLPDHRAVAAQGTSASASGDPFVGNWVDVQNGAITMSVRADAGIYRVTGSDEAYGYNLSCLKKDPNAVCTGNGGRLEGQNFLYQSTFTFTANGTITENWKAFNNLQTVNGQTTWRHP